MYLICVLRTSLLKSIIKKGQISIYVAVCKFILFNRNYAISLFYCTEIQYVSTTLESTYIHMYIVVIPVGCVSLSIR